ncbi:MAG: glycosyltransferase [Verrucomicrobia bacterium Tous-C9LFEB]|nr:MAG: glycosyltransferase [Verrucomicrobia bacterium Tous-C9LFEB]
MPAPLFLSAVVPCYNEVSGLPELYRRLKAACATVGQPYEIVLINDGSKDATWAKIRELTASDETVVGVNLSRNHGHQLALSAGLSLCRGEFILIIDADLQDPPELLSAMLQKMEEGADVVYGQRMSRKGETWFKKTTASAFYRLLNYLSDIDIPRDTGDFRLMRRNVLNALLSMPEQSRFIRGMVTWLGFRQVPLPYHRDERFAGETHYPLRKMLKLAIDAVTSFSIRPLRMATYFGLIVGSLTVLYALYLFISWALGGHVVAGWLSLMLVVLFIGSAQFVVMGVLGEYIGRIYIESKRRPLFLIQEVIGRSTAK